MAVPRRRRRLPGRLVRPGPVGPNADAQAKVRRKHRDLIGQIDEYDGEITGAPPQLAEAIQAIDDERAQLGANPMEARAAGHDPAVDRGRRRCPSSRTGRALTAMFEPRSTASPGRPAARPRCCARCCPAPRRPRCAGTTRSSCWPGDLAAGSPFCGPEVGDPTGLLLGVSLDGGTGTPGAVRPGVRPAVNTSPSLAAVGRLGSGKSFFLKRLCWDTVARGGQVVTIDRTRGGEYVPFRRRVPGEVQVVRLEAGADVCLDPLRTFAGDDRAAVTLGFLSLLAGCSAHSEEGAALAEAVDAVADPARRPPRRRRRRAGAAWARTPSAPTWRPQPGPPARPLPPPRRRPLAFGDGEPVSLDADFIVFWAPNLALPDRETLENEHRAARCCPSRSWARPCSTWSPPSAGRSCSATPPGSAPRSTTRPGRLLASPHGQSLLIEGVRDGRKHNGAIWLASQHPNDFAISELQDLLGSRFVFRQAPAAIPSALRFLGVPDSRRPPHAGAGLGTGQCLYRDVRERVGLIQVLPPPFPRSRRPSSAAGDRRRRDPATRSSTTTSTSTKTTSTTRTRTRTTTRRRRARRPPTRPGATLTSRGARAPSRGPLDDADSPSPHRSSTPVPGRSSPCLKTADPRAPRG